MEDNREFTALNEEQKKDLLKVLLRNAFEEKNNQALNYKKKADTLRELRLLYERKSEFKEGDLVVWKRHMKNRKLPDYGEPIIVLEVLAEPIFDLKEGIGSTYFNERFDIKAGIFRDETLLTFYFDSNRFELYVDE